MHRERWLHELSFLWVRALALAYCTDDRVLEDTEVHPHLRLRHRRVEVSLGSDRGIPSEDCNSDSHSQYSVDHDGHDGVVGAEGGSHRHSQSLGAHY